MTISELIKKLTILEKKGFGEYSVYIITETPNPPLSYSFVGIKDLNECDPGGWGNRFICLDPAVSLKKESNEKK